MALAKAALLRAVSDEIPVALLDKLGSTYIGPGEIEAVARTAITGEEGETGSTTFAGISRYVFVGGGNRAFIDPGGTLLQGARDAALAIRRARAADPSGLKLRGKTAVQKQKIQQQPTGAA